MNAELCETVDTVKYLKRGVSSVKYMSDFLAIHKETPTINWDRVNLLKGATFGEYVKMRNEGSILIANSILLDEGLPQRLSQRQQEFLARVDVQYSLRP